MTTISLPGSMTKAMTWERGRGLPFPAQEPRPAADSGAGAIVGGDVPVAGGLVVVLTPSTVSPAIVVATPARVVV